LSCKYTGKYHEYPIPVFKTRHYKKKKKGLKLILGESQISFLVSGYANSMTAQEIANNKGLFVKNIRSYPMRRSPNSVIFRLNLEGNEKAYLVLDGNFWPSAIIFKLWMSCNFLWKERQSEQTTRFTMIKR
jgi:hypothetical protein